MSSSTLKMFWVYMNKDKILITKDTIETVKSQLHGRRTKKEFLSGKYLYIYISIYLSIYKSYLY